ncbi:MAG: hypothetical protein WCA08_13080 [Desulfoferrobacter sp.]
MKYTLEIKWPWEMVWSEFTDELLAQIKDALPSDHPLQSHKLFPGIKWSGRPVFIVDDDTTGEIILMDFEKMGRWKRTKNKIPEIKILNDSKEVQEIIDNDHNSECSKYTQ